jgi:hypothetical protein
VIVSDTVFGSEFVDVQSVGEHEPVAFAIAWPSVVLMAVPAPTHADRTMSWFVLSKKYAATFIVFAVVERSSHEN